MAQSGRPPPLRNNSTSLASPPPLSPRTAEPKRNHVRRKSGKEGAAEKKAHHRPAPMTRRSTPQYVPKMTKTKQSQQHREDDEERRDSGESFLQFCMTCEKQFVPANNTFLYCSESCRRSDTAFTTPSRSNSIHSLNPVSPTTSYFTPYSPIDGPDIIPRASPTQSRPRSYFATEPWNTYTDVATTPPASHSATALASLRDLATALPGPGTNDRMGPSPPISRSGSAVWNYISIPFKAPTTTPQNSWCAASYNGHSTASRSREDLAAKSYHGPAYAQSTNGLGMDRPLPPRSGPGAYAHRPKSIDLVTPYVAQ